MSPQETLFNGCGITPLNTSELIVFDVDLLTVMSSLKKSHEENWFRINILLLILTNNSKVVYSRVCFIRINLLNSKFVVDAAKSGVTHETLQNAVRRGGKVMTEQEARLILGVSEETAWEEILKASLCISFLNVFCYVCLKQVLNFSHYLIAERAVLRVENSSRLAHCTLGCLPDTNSSLTQILAAILCPEFSMLNWLSGCK
ncbi:hypothetical protein Gohar_026785 [Gossypium harknessii]|uniref:Uncharacterized protein n=1 Tax=Gossypium harknessii TaxID=34285 RepID=A0A7J9HSN4_9ROSI|nr:hypothetical protein [Gossypium harknessii]